MENIRCCPCKTRKNTHFTGTCCWCDLNWNTCAQSGEQQHPTTCSPACKAERDRLKEELQSTNIQRVLDAKVILQLQQQLAEKDGALVECNRENHALRIACEARADERDAESERIADLEQQLKAAHEALREIRGADRYTFRMIAIEALKASQEDKIE